jgi:ribonuclease P/MRP protein subunit POP5
MRFKNRYYLVEILWEAIGLQPAAASSSSSGSVHRTSDVSFASHQLQSALREAMLSHFGEWGLARVLQSLQVRYLNSLTNLAILRVARADSRTMAAIIAFISQIKQKQILLRTVHLAGTIRSCQKRALQLQKQRIGEMAAQIAEQPATDADAHSKPVGSVLQAATARRPQKSAQQTLNQLSSLLSQYNAVQQQRLAAATSHTAATALASGASTGKISKSEQSVAPTVEAISAALEKIEQTSTDEIMAIDP